MKLPFPSQSLGRYSTRGRTRTRRINGTWRNRRPGSTSLLFRRLAEMQNGAALDNRADPLDNLGVRWKWNRISRSLWLSACGTRRTEHHDCGTDRHNAQDDQQARSCAADWCLHAPIPSMPLRRRAAPMRRSSETKTPAKGNFRPRVRPTESSLEARPGYRSTPLGPKASQQSLITMSCQEIAELNIGRHEEVELQYAT